MNNLLLTMLDKVGVHVERSATARGGSSPDYLTAV